MIISLFIIPTVFSETVKTTNFSVEVTDTGVPAGGATIYVATYQTAYESISSGDILDDVLNSSAWLDADSDGQGIQVAGLRVGKGVPHNDSETMLIISELFRTNYDLLQTINQSNNGIFGTFNSPSNVVQLHSPGEDKKQFTDKNGLAEGTVKEGLIAVLTSGKKLLYLGKADGKSGQIKVDRNASQGLNFRVKNMENEQSHKNIFTVSYNQTIEYSLTIDKGLLSQTGETLLSLKPDSNLVIDSTSIENTKTDLIQPTIVSPIAFDPNGSKLQLEKTAQQIGKNYIGQKLFSYSIKVPYSDKDVTITIKAHIAPTVSLKRNVQQSVANSSSPAGKDMDIPVNAFDSPNHNFILAANIFSVRGEGSVISPFVNTSSINFVETDLQKETFATGATYILGKKTGKDSYLYDSLGNWREVDDLSQVKASDYFSIAGGKMYIIGLNKTQDIPVNTERFNYDFDKNKKINQSLIQIYGLGQGEYFLLPVSPAQGYKLQNTFNFSIFLRYSVSSNGNRLIINNVSFPTDESYKLNGLIPDYRAGQNGYTVLPVSSAGKATFSKWEKILLPIGGIIFIIFIVGMIFVKVG